MMPSMPNEHEMERMSSLINLVHERVALKMFQSQNGSATRGLKQTSGLAIHPRIEVSEPDMDSYMSSNSSCMISFQSSFIGIDKPKASDIHTATMLDKATATSVMEYALIIKKYPQLIRRREQERSRQNQLKVIGPRKKLSYEIVSNSTQSKRCMNLDKFESDISSYSQQSSRLQTRGMPYYTETSVKIIDDYSDSNQAGEIQPETAAEVIGVIHEAQDENSILITDPNKLELGELSARPCSAKGFDSMSRQEEFSILEEDENGVQRTILSKEIKAGDMVNEF